MSLDLFLTEKKRFNTRTYNFQCLVNFVDNRYYILNLNDIIYTHIYIS